MLSNPFLFIYSIGPNQGGSFTVEVLFAGRKLIFSIPPLEWCINKIKAKYGYFQAKTN